MGGGGLGEREDAVDNRLEAARSGELQDRVELGLRAHVGAQKRELAAEEEAEIDFGIVAGGGAAGDQASSGGEAGKAVVPSGRANVFENDIDAALVGDAADFFADFLCFVIDEMVGAELFGFC